LKADTQGNPWNFSDSAQAVTTVLPVKTLEFYPAHMCLIVTNKLKVPKHEIFDVVFFAEPIWSPDS
jgi:hypothetical protein